MFFFTAKFFFPETFADYYCATACLCVDIQLRSPKASKKQVRFERKDRKKGKRKTERLLNRWKNWQKRIRDQEIKDKKDVKRENQRFIQCASLQLRAGG